MHVVRLPQMLNDHMGPTALFTALYITNKTRRTNNGTWIPLRKFCDYKLKKRKKHTFIHKFNAIQELTETVDCAVVQAGYMWLFE